MSIEKRRTVKKILIITYILIAIHSFGAESGFSAGGRSGWGSIGRMDNTILVPGKGNYPEIVLKSSAYVPDKDTDLLIHFDSGQSDITGPYRITGNTVKITDKVRIFGQGSGVFINTLEGLSLEPEEKALFAPGNPGSSFTIEFWLKPSLMDTGEEIVTYSNSVRDKTGRIIPQTLKCTVDNRKLVWEFRNFFFNPETYTSLVTVKGYKALLPDRWHHHMLTYNVNSGLLEYYVDDMLEGNAYATESGGDNGDPIIPITGSLTTGSLVLGKNYHGFMDEFRISKKIITDPVLSKFQNGYGRIETDLIDMGRKGSSLNRIDISSGTPGDSDIQCYYKIFEDYTDTINSGRNWIPFSPGEYLPSDTCGRFFKIRIDLFPDGSGKNSPAVHSIRADYRKNLPPLAPGYISAEAGDGEIKLNWKRIGEPDIKGYLVYYGTKSGVYFGKESSEGPSPIAVTGSNSLTIHGLTNGKLYYFAVAAFDSAGIQYPGALSEEISARPLPASNRDN